MQLKTTFLQAVELWLSDRAQPLSTSSTRSYRAEIARLAEFVSSEGGTNYVNTLSQEQWRAYLKSLANGGPTLAARRRRSLALGSWTQARRITANFLRWAHFKQHIDWLPDPSFKTSKLRSPLVNRVLDSPRKVTGNIKTALFEPLPLDMSLNDLRAHLVLNLAYWCGLSSSEIARLKVGDVRIRAGALKILSSQNEAILPEASVRITKLWRSYAAARVKFNGDFCDDSALICDLRSNRPIREWSIWSIIRAWSSRKDAPLTSRALRKDYLAAQAEETISKLVHIASYSRCHYVDYLAAH